MLKDTVLRDIIRLVKTKKYYEDLYEIPWKVLEEDSMNKSPPSKQNKLRVALINIPCGGFGDVIVCQTFYDYLKKWSFIF